MAGRIEKANEILEKIKSGDCDLEFTEMMRELLKVVVFLNQGYARLDRKSAQKNHDEVALTVQQVAKSHRSKVTAVIGISSAAITACGGLVGVASTTPGTSLGTNLAGRANFLSFFGDATFKNVFEKASVGMQGIGQGTGSFQQVYGGMQTGSRTELEHKADVGRKRASRQDEDASSNHGRQEKTLQALKQLDDAENAAKMRMAGG